MTGKGKPNRLIHESSPYLLQHAYNPVEWFSWGDDALNKARKENKLILVSIGYSSCHWCHVMERESFEDDEVAAIMNEHFICIKVDREERPDIDQVYMLAVQIMSGHGGWPLNCFALPDGRPVFGGTYFPRLKWMEVMENLRTVWEHEPEKVIQYAQQLSHGIKQSSVIRENPDPVEVTMDDLHSMVENWKEEMDNRHGGQDKAPKFPLPNNYLFLLRYAFHTKDTSILEHVKLTLDKMTMGGIYDQIGGGFARYSTDEIWKVPHFEKMLYDNAQLISLYSEAFHLTRQTLYKEIVYETIEFLRREMLSDEGAFYSALDADSEGVEGKFYTWTKKELEEISGEDFRIFADYYSVNNHGYWEHDQYILLRREHDQAIASRHGIETAELQNKVNAWKKNLLAAREKRIRPGLDDKSLTSWNALIVKGLCEAYVVFNEKTFLSMAKRTAGLLIEKQLREDGGLNHNYKTGRSSINGYLEDYCFFIEALIVLYQCTFEDEYLLKAKQLTDHTIEHFSSEEGMFFFTSDTDPPLIARKPELFDNVIPASNSSMANVLYLMGLYFGEPSYISMSKRMLRNMKNHLHTYGTATSNWGLLALNQSGIFREIVLSSEDPLKDLHSLHKEYHPFTLVASGKSDIPISEGRRFSGKNAYYVCHEGSCDLPSESLTEALRSI